MNHHLTHSDAAATPTGEVFEAAFTRAEVQKILQLSRPSVTKLFVSGELRAKKVGSQWRVQPKDLRQYLEGRATPAETASGSE